VSLLIIAEIGLNHNGSIDNAKKLIDMAKACGCDFVKFQKRTIDKVYSKEFLDSLRESPWGTTQREQKKAVEFGKDEYDIINDYCREKKIQWTASAWDLESLDFVEQYNPPFHKIASAMVTNEEFVEAVAKLGRHTMISTGGTTMPWIHHVVGLFWKHRCSFTLVHCVMVYPIEDEMCNVRMIQTLKYIFNCRIGYSSHSKSWEDCMLAVALGAKVVEKHITLDRAMYGTDQPASLEEGGLKRLVRECRKVKGYLGSGIKVFLPEEEISAKKLRWWEAEKGKAAETKVVK